MPAAWFYPAPSFSQLHCPGSMSCPSIGHNEWIHVLSIYSAQWISNKVHFINWKTFLGRDQKDQKKEVEFFLTSLILGSRWIGRHWSLLVVAAIRFCSLASPLGLRSLQRGAAAKHCSWQGRRDRRPHGAPRRRRWRERRGRSRWCARSGGRCCWQPLEAGRLHSVQCRLHLVVVVEVTPWSIRT